MKTFMMSKTKYAFVVILVLALLGWYLFEKNIGTINIPAETSTDVLEGEVAESLPGFELPQGFNLKIFAKDLPGARAIEFDPKGRVLVSQTSEGKIVALDDKNNDHVITTDKETTVLISELKKPQGMAFRCDLPDKCFLYVAERDVLSRFAYDEETPSLGPKEKILDLSSSFSDNHFTRSLLFLSSPNEDTLLISVGSSCNVCREKDSDYATILSYNIKTGKKDIYAKGLRNAVFMTLNPFNGKVYATEMGRDNLGDNLPPDEINIIEKKNDQPQNYGWPICYGKNIHDSEFDKNIYIRNPCMEPFEAPSFIDIPAHSAPLGLAFIPEEGWPEEYWGDLLIAYHGSWNRSTPTGYKIVRAEISEKGQANKISDFITGWLTATKQGQAEKIGRPVDIKVLSGGVAYISDDNAGVIYRLAR